MFKNKIQFLKINSEEGFAAIIISMIILAVIGLLVLGFASNTISNQKIALDNILSTQAYYDAESGINDAYNIISGYEKLGLSLSQLPANLNNCTNSAYVNSKVGSSSNQLDQNNSYSCLLVNPQPYSLEFKPVNQFDGQTFPIQTPPSARSAIHVLNISWQNHGITNSTLDFSSCSSTLGKFYTTKQYNSVNCNAPVLQVDIIPIDSLANSISATSLASKTTTVYLQPLSFNSPSSSTPTIISNGEILASNCSPTAPTGFEFGCFNRIYLPASSTGSYYVHIMPIYYGADVSVTAGTSSSLSSGVPLFGAQALIDSTGDSSGVFRRIEERICISTVCNNSSPGGALISNNQICKQFTSQPGLIQDRSGGGCPVP